MTHLTNGLPEVGTVSQEHNLLLDGVVEFAPETDAKAFFDGLLDVVLAYVEGHGGAAVLSMTHEVLVVSEEEKEEDGEQETAPER